MYTYTHTHTHARARTGGEAATPKPGQIDRRKFILHVEAGMFLSYLEIRTYTIDTFIHTDPPLSLCSYSPASTHIQILTHTHTHTHTHRHLHGL